MSLEDLSKEELFSRIRELEEKLKRNQKYGLVWEDKPEDVVLECEKKVPVLRNIKERSIRNDKTGPVNVLIEGDNYHALKILNYTHKGKVDVIYIDPPYNTGNKDFIYNDSFISKDDSFKHSQWLSFMERRLKLAKELLSDTGVIFISIDDNEQAQLKLLCDSIFGYNSFVSNIGVEITKTQGMKVKSAQDGSLVKNYEYVLVYSKRDDKKIVKNLLYDKINYYDEHYVFIYDDKNILPIKSILDKEPLNKFIDKYKRLKNIKSFSNKYINDLCSLSNDFKNEFYKYSNKVCRLMDCNITLSEDEHSLVNKGSIVNIRGYLLTKTGPGKIQQLAFLSDSLRQSDDFVSEYARCSIRGDLWKGFFSDMMNVEKEGEVEFKNGKKPKRLIYQLLKMVTSGNEIVLDFFAGSGTTGHAVLELNKEDGGNRQFILVTNNGDEKSEHKIAERITYKRLNKIMVNGVGNKNFIGGNLEYLKCDFIDKVQHEDNMKLLLAENSTDIISLKEGVFDNKKELKDNGELIYTIMGDVSDSTHIIAIYHSFDDFYINDFKRDLNKFTNNKTIYLNPLLDSSDMIKNINNIKIEETPSEI